MTDKPYHTTRCLCCGWELTHPEFEPVDVRTLKGEAPLRLQEFHTRLLGHIQRCADDEKNQLRKIEKRAKTHPDEPPPDYSLAKHQDALVNWANMLMLAQSRAILRGFTTTDPALQSMDDWGRWTLHQASRKFHFTDDMIRDRLAGLSLTPKGQEAVFAFVSELRDVLEELNLYMPGREGAEIATAHARADAANAGQP